MPEMIVAHHGIQQGLGVWDDIGVRREERQGYNLKEADLR